MGIPPAVGISRRKGAKIGSVASKSICVIGLLRLWGIHDIIIRAKIIQRMMLKNKFEMSISCDCDTKSLLLRKCFLKHHCNITSRERVVYSV